MHRIHQEYYKHSNNCGNIICWDMLSGTYENPEEFKSKCGFDNDRKERLLDMLQFKNMHIE